MNWKSLGHHCGSETFPWQLGLVSAEANCVLCLNLTDGNGAAPGCGLMLPPRLLKLSGLTLFLGRLQVCQGSASISKQFSRMRGEYISLSHVMADTVTAQQLERFWIALFGTFC